MRNLVALLLTFVMKIKVLFNRFLIGLKFDTIQVAKGTIIIGSVFKGKGQNNKLLIGKGATLRNVTFEINGSNNQIRFGNKSKVYEDLYILIEGDDCTLSIGDKTTIGGAYFSFGENNTSIHIGEDCMFSRDIRVATSDFHSIIDLVANQRINHAENVSIGNHVWVGNGVVINKGVNLPSNMIIGSKAVVAKKNFQPNSLIGGIPAKELKSNVNWDRQKL